MNGTVRKKHPFPLEYAADVVRNVLPQAIYSVGLVGKRKPRGCLSGDGTMVIIIIITSVNGIGSGENSLLSTMAINVSVVGNRLLSFLPLTIKMAGAISTVEKLGRAVTW